jgi:hypothetical protein
MTPDFPPHGNPFRTDVKCTACGRPRERITVTEYLKLNKSWLSSVQVRPVLAREGIWYWVDCECGRSGEETSDATK